MAFVTFHTAFTFEVGAGDSDHLCRKILAEIAQAAHLLQQNIELAMIMEGVEPVETNAPPIPRNPDDDPCPGGQM